MSELGVILMGYLLGSAPFGLLLVRLAGLGDVRAIGSGNIGTTNVLRTGRKDLAAATLVLDALKGGIAVGLAALLFEGSQPHMALAGAGAFLGHCFPVWLKFHGGKGVATYLGTMLAFDWRIGLVAIIVWILVAATTRYSSLSALTAALAAPPLLAVFGHMAFCLAALFMTGLVFYRHRENIARLKAGTEGKIGQKSTPQSTEPPASEG